MPDIWTMMKPNLITLFTLLSFCLSAQEIDKKELALTEGKDLITVDGTLDEPQWKMAAKISTLDQFFPDAAPQPAYLKNDIRIFYTQKGIYFGMRFTDEQGDIKHQMTERDQGSGNTDYLQLIINPFNDGANDFNFYLSAAGAQEDSRTTFDGEDNSWNAVWESATTVSEFEWTAEIYIPYRALRIPKKSADGMIQPWGFNIKRVRRSDRTSYSWNPIDRNFSNESLQSGLLTGIDIKNPPPRVSLRPNATASLSRGGDGAYHQTGAAGADIKVGINKSFTVDMTLLPDFSQVAYDEQFVNFEPFERQFDENRQFFTEGVNLFNKGNLFYSRRIGGNPKNFTNANLSDLNNTTQDFTRMLNATKLTGTTDKNLSVGFLNALTAPNYATGVDSMGNAVSILTEPMTNYNVMAFDQRVRGNSSFGMINTHVWRSNSEGQTRDAWTSALTANLNVLNNTHYWNAVLAQSTVYDIDNPFRGENLEWEMGRQVGAWRWEHELQVTSQDFDPNDMGFITRGNRIHQDFAISHQILQPKGAFLRKSHKLGVQYRRLYEPNVFERVHMEYHHFALTRGFWAYGYDLELRPAEYDYFDPRVWGRYRINPASHWHNMWFSMDYRKPVAVDGNLGYWQWADFNAGGWYGKAKILARVNDQLNFWAQLSANDFNQVGWAQTLSTDSIGMAVRRTQNVEQSLQARYLFSPNSYVRLDLRHSWNRIDPMQTYHLETDGSMIPSDAYTDMKLRINIYNLDIKYVLWFAPGRELNLLYRGSLAYADDQTELDYWKNMQSLGSIPTDHLLSLRVVYFLDYAELAK